MSDRLESQISTFTWHGFRGTFGIGLREEIMGICPVLDFITLALTSKAKSCAYSFGDISFPLEIHFTYFRKFAFVLQLLDIIQPLVLSVVACLFVCLFC
jgi:hypothetical protein